MPNHSVENKCELGYLEKIQLFKQCRNNVLYFDLCVLSDWTVTVITIGNYCTNKTEQV